MKIFDLKEDLFLGYGKILTLNESYKKELDTIMGKNDMPQEGNCYTADDEKFSGSEVKKYFAGIFGGSEIQVGFCNGYGTQLNALEYHKCSEIIYAVTDLILLIGKPPLVNNRYNSKDLVAFKIKKGTAVELNSEVLHFAPIAVCKEGFKAVIGLTKGTNTPLADGVILEDKALWQTNKWLICHKEFSSMIEKGAVEGIDGENIQINY